MKNWKTTLIGILIGGATALKYMGIINPEIYGTIVGVLTTAGLVFASDGKKSDDPIENQPTEK